MKKLITLVVATCCTLLLSVPVINSFAMETADERISGHLAYGYRILAAPTEGADSHYTVYRGDYIKFDLDGTADEVVLVIPALSIRQNLKGDYREGPYFKMKEVGVYPFTLGSGRGVIEVVEFDRPQYSVVTADEAVRLIRNISPLILDVRTAEEYNSGHLENAVLIPVQELQQRYTELLKYRDEDLFIYCATGNRSTVAAKILIDNGFVRVYNLRYGLTDWVRSGYPLFK